MNVPPSLLDTELPDDAPTILSVCSGVGGKDLGFHRAGFRTVGLCEWDPWRRRVLARHWPGVPIHEDLAALADWAERDPDAVREWLGCQPDVLIGGTPCQDLSHAGKRAGIDGERSGLFFAFMRLRNALGVRWTVWENVAGALTSNSGLDFMAVVGAFVGAPVAVPGDGVGGAGVAAGPWGGCVWRLLNAQHFGVPQRRRRVFVVGRLGGPCPPEVLIEPDGGGRDTAAGREAGTLPPWAAAARAGGAGRSGLAGDPRGGPGGRAGAGADGNLGQPVAGPLGAGSGGGWRNDLDSHGAYVDTASAITNGGQSPDGYDDNSAAAGFLVAPAVTKSPGFAAGCGHSGGDEASIAVAATLTGRAGGRAGRGAEDDRNVVGTVTTRTGSGPWGAEDVVGAGDRVPHSREDGRAEGRRPRADADEVGEPGGEHAERPAAADADGVRATDGLAGPVDVPAVGGVAVSSRGRDGGATLEEAGDVSPALRGSSGGGSRQMVRTYKMAHRGHEDGDTWREADVTDALTQPSGTQSQALVAFDGATHALTAEGFDASEDGTGRGTPIVGTYDPERDEASPCGCPWDYVDGGGFCACCQAHIDDPEGLYAIQGDGTHSSKGCPLTGRAVAWDNLSNGGASDELSPTVRGGGGNTMPHVAPTLRGSTGNGGGGHKDIEDLAIADALTRGELPPGADRCAWDPQPDGRRYAACGDGVAAPHAHWIGLRLARYVRASRAR